MKMKLSKITKVLIASLVFITLLGGCNNQREDNNQGTSQGTKDGKKLSGAITIAGSTSMEKLANAAGEAFMDKYPNVRISPEFIGSSAGVEAVLNGTVNIGNASRYLKESEKSKGAVENIVAIDGIAIITDTKNTVSNLSKEELIGIYTGTIRNWSDVGGSNQPVVVVGRESGSGTRGAFEEILGVEDQCNYSNEINSTGGVMAKVASTPGAIGYVSIDILDDTVSTINLDETEPTEANIKAGNYLLSRPFVMATNGEITEQNELVQAFFEYLKSEEGRELIKNVGLITVDN